MGIPKRSSGLFDDGDDDEARRHHPPHQRAAGQRDDLDAAPDDERIRVTVRLTLAQTECLEDEIRMIRRVLRTRMPLTALVRGFLEGYLRSSYRLDLGELPDRVDADSLERAIAEQLARRLAREEDL